MRTLLTDKCAVCSKPFVKRSSRVRSACSTPGVQRVTAKTCSRKCSRKYTIIKRMLNVKYQTAKRRSKL